MYPRNGPRWLDGWEGVCLSVPLYVCAFFVAVVQQEKKGGNAPQQCVTCIRRL